MLACGNVCIVLQLTPHLCPALGAPAGFLPRVRTVLKKNLGAERMCHVLNSTKL